MIEILLATVVWSGPYDWQMTCEQTLEAIETVKMDPWFAKPENRRHRWRLIEKMKAHGPTGCVPVEV